MKIAVWLFTTACFILGTRTHKLKRPHIIYVLADDLGWNDVSFHGSLQIPTPNIDTLAANSIVLNNYYTQPICTPSRAALMTGKHPIEYGLQHSVLLGANPSGLYLNMTLLPQHFKNLGYKTHAIGKWHLGFFQKEYAPSNRGFDTHLGYWPGAMDYYNHTYYERYQNQSLLYGWGRALRREMKCADNYDGKYATTLFTEEAENLIRTHDKSKPMLLYLAHLAVHSANKFDLFQAPAKYVDMVRHIKNESRREFGGMVSALDESIGKLFQVLEKNHMLDNTIFVLSTDNGGESHGYRGGVGSNWPLRGNKGTTWEAGVRGIALIWSPLIKQCQRISNQFMSIVDWLPTLYRAAGGDTKVLGNIYGVNVWDAIKYNKPSPRKELLHNIDPVEHVQTLRKGDYKLMMGSNIEGDYDEWYGPTGKDNGISTSEYRRRLRKCAIAKVLKKRKNFKEVSDKWLQQLNVRCKSQQMDPSNCIPTKAPCLFNIVLDPCEQDNVADKYPKIVEYMKKRLQEYNAMAVPPVNQTIDPRSDPRLYDDHWTNWADSDNQCNYK